MHNYNVHEVDRYNASLYHEIYNKFLVIIVFECNFYSLPSLLFTVPPSLLPSFSTSLHQILLPSLFLFLYPSLPLSLLPFSLTHSYPHPFLPFSLPSSLIPPTILHSYSPLHLPSFLAALLHTASLPPSLHLSLPSSPALLPSSLLPFFLWYEWLFLCMLPFFHR